MTTPGTDTSTNGANPQATETKAHFQAMLAPSSKAVSRKAWGIDVSTVWLPYFTAAKTVGAVDDVDLPDASLGAPFRIRRDKDTNEVRFSQSGRPMFYVAPELNAMVNRARDNYIAGLIQQTAAVSGESPELYEAQVARQQQVGNPIQDSETADLALAVVAHAETEAAALVEAEAPKRASRSRKTS